MHRRRFPKKQQHPRCRNLGYVKNSGISVRMPRANTAEKIGQELSCRGGRGISPRNTWVERRPDLSALRAVDDG